MNLFCTQCGHQNEADSRFCESCGSPVPVSMLPAADVAPQAPNVDLHDRSQPPRRRWALYAVGALSILGIGIIAVAFFGIGAGSAGTPSESSARAVFESRHSQSIQAGLMKIESFQKFNGQKLTLGGAEVYKLEYVATVVYPKGVMPECIELIKQSVYHCVFAQSIRDIDFKPVGHREKIAGHITFQNTERGWQGEDGKIY